MAGSRPNIIVCMCDQLRAFEVGCYGNPVARTPNMNRLAAEGVRFETAISNAPVCMAARSVLLSGQYARTCNGVTGNVSVEMPDKTVRMSQYPEPGRPHMRDTTLPEALRDAGYYTAAIGKWHVHSRPGDIGFQSSLIPRNYHCHTDQYYMKDGGPEFRVDGYSVDWEAQRVGTFLNEARSELEPFFLYYNISPPHMPIADAPEKYLGMFFPDEIPLRPNVSRDGRLVHDEHWFSVYRWDFRYYHEYRPHTQQLPAGYDLRHMIAEYYGATTWVDDVLGRLLANLERTGLSENTIVVFTSDHGDMLGSHHLFNKGNLYEESIRIPMIVRCPDRIEPMIANEQITSLVDLAPTLLEMAGVCVPDTMQGRSIAPVLRGEAASLSRNYAYIEAGGHGGKSAVGVRTPTHTFGLQINAQRKTESALALYDLSGDPYQQRNLVDTPEQQHLTIQLGEQLRKWNESTCWLDVDA